MASHSLDVLSRLARRVPDDMVERARAWPPGAPSAPAAPAASVILLRDGPDGLETYLLHRHARMSFAASMVVFPGGKVDPVDHRQPDPILSCAIRETEEETGVRLTPEDLQPWAYWVTPQVEPRRYDTYFFVALLPGGQRTRDVGGEAAHTRWAPPAVLADDGTPMLPPTSVTLRQIARHPTIGAVLASAATREAGRPIRPGVELQPDGSALLIVAL